MVFVVVVVAFASATNCELYDFLADFIRISENEIDGQTENRINKGNHVFT